MGSHIFVAFMSLLGTLHLQNPMLDSPIPWKSPSAAIRMPLQKCVAQISLLATTKTHMVKHLFYLL